MNKYISGEFVKELRIKNNLTQAALAEKLGVSDKAVSKWETGKGYPDISLLAPLASIFQMSLSELLMGVSIENKNVSANMMRSKFYVCPVCGNVMHSMGEALHSCHGIELMPLEAEEEDEEHQLKVEIVEDEYFVSMDHFMTKDHYISFMAAISFDKVQMMKLYPEGNAEGRFKMSGVKEILYYCNHHGFFKHKIARR